MFAVSAGKFFVMIDRTVGATLVKTIPITLEITVAQLVLEGRARLL